VALVALVALRKPDQTARASDQIFMAPLAPFEVVQFLVV
jgi:hypothetical protein